MVGYSGTAVRRNFAASSPEMAALIAEKDWSQTLVGSPDRWSSALHQMIDHLLGNGFGLLLWWGPEYVQFYNDAYRPVLGTKHPHSLGQPASECFAEIWDVIGPMIDQPFHGGAPSVTDDLYLEVDRYGFLEETHFTVAYSPVFDETVPDGIGGVIATVHEVTEKIIGERRIRLLSELGTLAAEAKTAEEACAIAAQVFATDPRDIPCALIYLIDSQHSASLIASTGTDRCRAFAPSRIALDDPSFASIAEALEAGSATVLPPMDGFHRPVIVPIRATGLGELAGFTIAGTSPRLALTDTYLQFFDLIAAPVATAIANARAYEEERKRAEALAEIDRAKNTFFSNVSHEFRTPLTLMLGPLDELSKSVDGASASLVDIAQRNSLRLLKLVNTLLEFSRIEAGRLDASYVSTDAAELTRDLCSSFRSLIESAGLAFDVDIDLTSAVYLDRSMWEKIVLNLLSNAFKFTLNGSIHVTLTERGSHAELIVEDTGIGIPASDVSRVFERFHRVRSAEGRSHEGTGIGLALTRDLVQLHGGSIEVRSEPGRGSAFIVRIPLGCEHLDRSRIALGVGGAQNGGRIVEQYVADIQSTTPAASVLNGQASKAGVNRSAVLVVDDNRDLREYMRRVLAPHYHVELANDGVEALELMRSGNYELVVSDIMMPKMDGITLLARVRDDPSLAEIPFIFLSARAGEGAAVEGLARGADGYLVKPFSPEDLIARTEALLRGVRERKRSERRFRALADTIPVSAWTCDDTGKVEWCNKSWFAYFGPIDDAAGWDWKRVGHPDDFREAVHRWARACADREPFEMTLRLRGVDGRYRWFLTRAVPIFDETSGVVRWYGTSTNVDSERQAAEQLDAFARLGEHTTRAFDRVTTLEALGYTLIPAFADGVLVAIANESDELTVAYAAHRDARVNESFQRYVGTSYEPAVSEGERIAVPIVVGGRILGTMHLFSAAAREYDAMRPFLEEIGRRIGVALDSSENYQRHARIARSFQDAALPSAMPTMPGMFFSAFYEPASIEDRLGGDFYDAFRLLDGRIVLSIGDVAGSGLGAATIMAAIRQSIRAAASINPDPVQMLKAAEGVFIDHGGAPFASVFVAVVEPMTFVMHYANAGHTPPLLRTPDGTVIELKPNDLLLGVSDGSTREGRRVGRLSIEPGSFLVMYTDGLTEATHDASLGETRLLETVGRLQPESGSAPGTARRIRDMVIGRDGVANDDVALLSVFFEQPIQCAMTSAVVQWEFDSANASEAHSARNEMIALLRGAGLNREELFAAEMVFSELVGNAKRHAGGAIEVALDLTRDLPVLHVMDDGPGLTLNPKLPAEPYAERGRGLYIVRMLTRECTASLRRLMAGTHVRAVLFAARRRSN